VFPVDTAGFSAALNYQGFFYPETSARFDSMVSRRVTTDVTRGRLWGHWKRAAWGFKIGSCSGFNSCRLLGENVCALKNYINMYINIWRFSPQSSQRTQSIRAFYFKYLCWLMISKHPVLSISVCTRMARITRIRTDVIIRRNPSDPCNPCSLSILLDSRRLQITKALFILKPRGASTRLIPCHSGRNPWAALGT